jgi:hypothetical protein
VLQTCCFCYTPKTQIINVDVSNLSKAKKAEHGWITFVAKQQLRNFAKASAVTLPLRTLFGSAIAVLKTHFVSGAKMTNVALNKNVVMSSQFVYSIYTTPASAAVDGDPSTSFGNDGHCTYSDNQVSPHVFILGRYSREGMGCHSLWVQC